jgi:hypothetical protein
MNGQRKAAQTIRTALCLLVLMAGMVTPAPQQARAQQTKTFTNAGDGFAYQWNYSDRAVDVGGVPRTWLWGKAPIDKRAERMVGSPAHDIAPADNHVVQYYDKARMEFDAKNRIVTNGRLVVEMLSGSIQTSLAGNEYFPFLPNRFPIAGDVGNPNTPSYASLFSIATIDGDGPRAAPLTGTLVTATYARSGAIGVLTGTVPGAPMPRVHSFYPPSDPNKPDDPNALLGHNIPDVFMEFLTQSGDVWNAEEDDYYRGNLFENWVTAVGLPITEPYWAQVRIDGKDTWVMFQAFERRVLTYNPSTVDPSWRVEMGNVGRHYYEWRPEPLAASPLGGVQVIESSINGTAEVCLGISDLCPPEKVVPLPRSFRTILRSNDTWARTKLDGRMILHSDNVAYSMQPEAKLVFKRIENSVDSVLQQSGRVNYLHEPKRRLEIETGTGLVTAYGTHFSVIMTDTTQLGIIVPDDGGSVTLQLPPPQTDTIEVLSSTVLLIPKVQVLTAIKSQPVSYTIRPTTQEEEDYWDEELARLRSFPELKPKGPSATTFGDPAFERQWDYSDKAVADGAVARTWLWGPAPLGAARPERMVGSPARGASPADHHLVQYFDKGRMEFNARQGVVTSGHLVVEMMSGSIKTSLADDEYFTFPPSSLPIAGDTAVGAAHPDTPTYASLSSIANIGGKGARATPIAVGTRITATYARLGTIGTLPADAAASNLMPTVGTFYPPGNPDGHNLPNVFVNFLTQRGLVSNGPSGQYRTDYLFEGNNWVTAVGLPITEPYWTQVRIAGKNTWIMFQAFQRRILIYNPSTVDPTWRVEMGNVGQHYKDWRPEPLAAPPPGGVRVIESSPNGTAEVCLGNAPNSSTCPGGQLVSLPRPFPTILQPGNSWAKTRANGFILLHSDNVIYDMKSSATLVFKRVDNSIDSVRQESGQVNYLPAPNRRIEVETNEGLVTPNGPRFSLVVTNTAQVGQAALSIIVPSLGGSVTLQPPSPGGGLPAPAPIVVKSGQVLVVIKGPPVSYNIRPTTPGEERYWGEK